MPACSMTPRDQQQESSLPDKRENSKGVLAWGREVKCRLAWVPGTQYLIHSIIMPNKKRSLGRISMGIPVRLHSWLHSIKKEISGYKMLSCVNSGQSMAFCFKRIVAQRVLEKLENV